MKLIRWGLILASGAVVAAAAGCGNDPAKVTSPATHAEDALAVSRGAPARDSRPPAVRITCPLPSAIDVHVTPPALRILWEGFVRDLRPATRPVEYRYILLGPGSEFPPSLAVSDPDSLRRYYLARDWAGWTSTGATTEVRFSNLIPNEEYVFAVIAFDRSGPSSQVFSLSTNMLHFRVSFDGYPGLRLAVGGPRFVGSFIGFDPSDFVPARVGEGRRMMLRWRAEPGGTCRGVEVRSYRWALDIADLLDETPRIDEATDLSHWSQPSLGTSATLPAFTLSNPPAPEEHNFYVEATDIVGVVTLGTVRIMVVPLGNRLPDAGPGRLSETIRD